MHSPKSDWVWRGKQFNMILAYNILQDKETRWDLIGELVAEWSWILSDRRVKQYMAAAYLGIDQATYSR